MQDRPTIDELLAAIEGFLDAEIVPNVPGSRGYHARVAANTLRIVRRELKTQERDLRDEWAGLDPIIGTEPLPADLDSLRDALRERNTRLCQIIADPATSPESLKHVFALLRTVVDRKLAVTNPELLARQQTLDGDDSAK
jgi:hypothetical protein